MKKIYILKIVYDTTNDEHISKEYIFAEESERDEAVDLLLKANYANISYCKSVELYETPTTLESFCRDLEIDFKGV